MASALVRVEMAALNPVQLHRIGYTLKCCRVCTHSRFFDKANTWGRCLKYSDADGNPLYIHQQGHCRRGFKVYIPDVVETPLEVLKEFL